MTNSNYEAYLVSRPLFSKFKREYGIPVIRKINPRTINYENAHFLNFSNIKNGNTNSIILMFHDDKKLEKLWNNPLKMINKFRNCQAVVTPDFTIQCGMDLPLIINNIYRNRWLGCTYQQFGINVIPSISWADEKTFDICFSGIEEGGTVAVSTIGCKGIEERQIFLKGYKELLRRKHPSLILCYGRLIKGMTGNILPIEYEECFNNGNEEITTLFKMSRIIEIKESDFYGR